MHMNHQLPARTLPKRGACDNISALVGCESFDTRKFVCGCHHHLFFKWTPSADLHSNSWCASARRSCQIQCEASTGAGILAPEDNLLVGGISACCPECPKSSCGCARLSPAIAHHTMPASGWGWEAEGGCAMEHCQARISLLLSYCSCHPLLQPSTKKSQVLIY